ncbi:hypothetical protein IW262DRAFT_1336473 [Armillaria fumosa]|nr:hypothetical protein IW262DRAFT_1336473 [Armillaria fumosa]
MAMMARHKLHASRGCTGSAHEGMEFIARSWLCIIMINESINIQFGRKDAFNERLYLVDFSKVLISIGEDDFVLLCGRGNHSTFRACLSSWFELTLCSNKCFLSTEELRAKLACILISLLPEISTIGPVMREARLRRQCLHAFMRPSSFPHPPMLCSPKLCSLRSLLMNVGYNSVAREPKAYRGWYYFPPRLTSWSTFSPTTLIPPRSAPSIDFRYVSPPQMTPCSLLLLLRTVYGESTLDGVGWNSKTLILE